MEASILVEPQDVLGMIATVDVTATAAVVAAVEQGKGFHAS
jgi:hypothetical protein